MASARDTSGSETQRSAHAGKAGGPTQQRNGAVAAGSAASGGPVGSAGVLALQRLAGNQAVAGAFQGRPRGPAVVQRKGEGPARAQTSRNGVAATLEPEDSGDVGLFFAAVGNVAGQSLARAAEPAGVSNGDLARLELRLEGVRNLTRRNGPHPDLEERALPDQVAGQWDRLRPELDAVATWASSQGFDAGAVTEYRTAVRTIDRKILEWYSVRVIQDAAGAIDVGDPKAAYEEQLSNQMAKELAAGAKLVLQIDETQVDQGPLAQDAQATNQATNGAGDEPKIHWAKEGARASKVAGAGAGTGSAGAAAVKMTHDMAALALTAMAQGGSIQQMIAGTKQAGVPLKDAATAVDLAKFFVDATWTVLSLKTKVIIAASAEAGTRLQTFLGQVKSAGMDQLDTVGRALGYVTSVMGVATSALKLIDAINSGDTKAKVRAGGSLAESLLNIAVHAGKGGATAGLQVTIVVFLWVETIIAIGELGALLRELDLQAKGRRVRRMVDDAAIAAETGRRMAAAWDEAQRRRVDEVERPGSMEGRSAAVLEATAIELLKDPLLGQINQVRAHLNQFADDEDVDPAVRKTVTEHLGRFDNSFGRIEPLPPLFTDLCQMVFADVNSVTRSIAQKAGHLPERQTG